MARKPAIVGISHITLLVEDLERSTQLYTRLFDAEVLYQSGANTHSIAPEVFLEIAGKWFVLMQGTAPGSSYQHIAFQVAEGDQQCWLDRLHTLHVDVIPSRPRISGEGWSIYFRDPDGHLFELHAGELAARLAAYTTDANSQLAP